MTSNISLRILSGILLCSCFFCSFNFIEQSKNADIFLQSTSLHKALFNQEWETVITSIPKDSNVARDPRVMLLIGHASYGLGQNNAATTIFTLIADSASLGNWEKWTARLSAKNMNSSVAHYLYGDALARNAKYDQALKEFSEAVKLNEQFCLALNARGVVYDIKGDLNQASDDFEIAVEHCSDFADTYVNIGVLYLQRGFRGAGEQFEKALKKDPTHGLAYNGKACYHASIGEIDTARNAIILANKHLKDNPYLVINARAFTDSTDTTSVLGKIANANSDSLARGMFMRALNLIIPDEFKAGAKFAKVGPEPFLEFKWDLKKLNFSEEKIKSTGGLRGGIYFNIREGLNLKVNDTAIKRKVATEFTLAYPRVKR